MRTAVALFSGGLDSEIAICVVKAQGVRVIAYHMVSVFSKTAPDGGPHEEIVRACEKLGVELHWEEFSERLVGLVRNPQFGHGSNLNPCIDCHFNMILRAEEHRKAIGADFLITGEVLGQRPMSQNKGALELIARKSGLEDILLRPLSAPLLEPPTKPEREGWVKRDQLPSISGRGRKEQMALAKHFGITEYSNPAGGCLLTDPGFNNRLRDLMERKPDFVAEDVKLLKVGRHFRVSPEAVIVSGREEQENTHLEKLAQPEDMLFQNASTPGSIILARPAINGAEADIAAGLAVHYSRDRANGSADVACWQVGGERKIMKAAKVVKLEGLKLI